MREEKWRGVSSKLIVVKKQGEVVVKMVTLKVWIFNGDDNEFWTKKNEREKNI